MKIILSRKGFDASSGGMPSVIFPDGRIVSIPIPGESDEPVSYGEIRPDGEGGGTMYELLAALTETVSLRGKKVPLTADTRCHADPDLVPAHTPGDPLRRGAFGQIGAAQTVLEKANVQAGDLFLFFGWFQKTEYDGSGRLRFCPGNGFHMLYGWLQIASMIYTAKEAVPDSLRGHPHAISRRSGIPSNCIYVGRDTASWDSSVRGFGVFSRYDPELVLTKPGMSRSRWALPDAFRGLRMTYHSEKSWHPDYFQSACRGQEFVTEESPLPAQWAEDLILRGIRRDAFSGGSCEKGISDMNGTCGTGPGI